jgi:hypothetical protein
MGAAVGGEIGKLSYDRGNTVFLFACGTSLVVSLGNY